MRPRYQPSSRTLARCSARTSHSMAEKVFTGRGLMKVYTSGEVNVRALQGVDIDVWASEMIVLLGPSGSGKSTLLNIMGGLDHATSGTLQFRNVELTTLDDSGLTA